MRTKRIAVWLFIAVCLIPGLAPAKPVIIRVWTFPMLPELRDHEVFEGLCADFRREQPNIEVQIEMLPWAGRAQKMLTAVAGGHAPDSAYLNLDLLPLFLAGGALREADECFEVSDRDDYLPGVLDAVSSGGRTWLAPILRTATVSLYNKDLFAGAGLDPEKPPQNWDELSSAAKALTRDTDGDGHIDQWGVGYPFGETLNMTFWPLLWQAGGDILSHDQARSGFAGPEGVEALSYAIGLFRSGVVPPSFMGGGSGADIVGGEFAAGKLGYIMAADSAVLRALRRDAPKVRIGVAPTLTHRRRVSFGSIGSFCVFAKSRHPHETILWLRFLSRRENMRRFCHESGFSPVRKSVGSIYENDPLMNAIDQETQYCRPGLIHPKATAIMKSVTPELQSAALGRKSPEQALKDAAKVVDALLGRRN